ncbi:variable surface protein, partial [Plasmodium gonderi]
MRAYLGDKELAQLPTKKMYDIFDKAASTSNCSSIDTNVKNLEKSNPGIEKVSDRIHKALCYVYNENEANKFDEPKCDYLYFWLGDVVHSNLSNSMFFNTVMDTIKHFLQNSKGQSICNYSNYNNYNINENDFMDIKILFDYTKDYVHIKNDLDKYDKYCNREYKDLLGKYTTVYNKIKDVCEKYRNKYSYCNDFNEYLKESKRWELSNTACTEVVNQHEIEKILKEQQMSKEYNMNQEGYPHANKKKLEYLISNNPSA